MGRRRRRDDFEELIGPLAVLLFLFGAVILAFVKALLLIVLIVAGIALAGFLLYLSGRTLCKKLLGIEAYLPSIDWTLPAIPSLDNRWLGIRYPEFPAPSHVPAPHIIGTSGAWKDVLRALEGFPCSAKPTPPRAPGKGALGGASHSQLPGSSSTGTQFAREDSAGAYRDEGSHRHERIRRCGG
jgi:hypothetical protein